MVLPQDKSRSVEHAAKTLTIEELRKGIGYQSTKRAIPHLKECFIDNFHLSSLNREPIINVSEIATIDKPRISTKTV